MTLELDLSIRLLASGLFAMVIGYEREHRSKGAGIRTHVLVALGSALFMIISQYAFGEASRFDASRVAAGVVSGIGFLGGGIIMKNKHVTGLTTAAGLWVTAAIGMAAGSGMYIMAGLCTFLVLICLEAMHFLNIRTGERDITVTLSSPDDKALIQAMETLGKEVQHFSLSHHTDVYKMELAMLVKKRESRVSLLTRLNALPGVKLESVE